MPFGPAIAPVVLVIVLSDELSTWLWPALDTTCLADPRHGATSVQAARGVIGGLDALPHNGAVVTLPGICKPDHRQSSLGIFAVAVAIPLLALVPVVVRGTGFGSF